MTTLFAPYVAAAPAAPAWPAREWDVRLEARGARLTEYVPRLGDTYWRCIRGVWFNEIESQGRHHIFVDLLDEQGRRVTGIPVRFRNGGEFVTSSEAKAGEQWAANFGMYAAGCAYSVEVAHASDIVGCLGLGSMEAPQQGIHCSYGFVFQRVTQGAQTPPPVVEPPPVPPVDPLPTTPDAVMDSMAVALHVLDTARQAIATAMELYSRQSGG